MKLAVALLAVLVLGAPAGAVPAGARDSQSAPLARHLAAVLTARHLDAIAASDPGAPDRFVGALFFPDVQLLVVAGRYAAPDALRAQIAAHQYKDVYLALTSGSAPDTRLFFQDLKADGLHAAADGGVDVMYEHVDKQNVFDGKADRARFDAADAEYSRLLSLLLNEAEGATTTHSAAVQLPAPSAGPPKE